ncbi:AfsR/SARP family transcriptional regulator [Streptomyces sp. M19]
MTLRSYLSRLRAALSPLGCGIRREPNGYVLDLGGRPVDLYRFRALVSRAHAAGDEEAAALYGRALGLWRGEALAGLDTPWADDVRGVLGAERFAAELAHHDVRLRRGEHAELLPGLAALATAHPLDERLAGQLLLALYRNGRQADALEHYEGSGGGWPTRSAPTPAPAPAAAPADPGRRPRDRRARTPAPPGPAPPPRSAVPGRRFPVRAAVPVRSPPTPRQPSLFTGRAGELAGIDDALRDGAAAGGVGILALGGCGESASPGSPCTGRTRTRRGSPTVSCM